MCKVSVRVSCGSDSLIYLREMYCFPGNVFMGQSPKHEPGCLPAAHRHDESPTRCDCFSGFGSDKDRSRLRRRFCIVVYFKLHCKSFSQAATATNCPLALGLLHPPCGATRCISGGPQVFGSYSKTGV